MIKVAAGQMSIRFDRAAERFPSQCKKALTAAATVALARAKEKAPGKLGKTLKKYVSEDGFGLTSTTPVAGFVENGTRAHVIEAKAAGCLAFMANGRMVFRRSVNHPGTKAHPFMRPAIKEGMATLKVALGQLSLF